VLPNLITIGAQKCGTSALHYYLSFHPEVRMSTPKELNFFIKKRNWEQGQEWYESHFGPDGDVAPDVKVHGESSPNYTAFPHFKGVARRMHETVPEAKLIYLVRDPVDRIVSQFMHNWTKRRRSIKRQGIAATVLEPGTTYVPRSCYWMQLEKFLKFYPESSVLVLAQNDLRDERVETLEKVFRFLGVEAGFYDKRYERLRHQTQKKERKTRVAQVGERLPPAVWSRLEDRVTVMESLERPVVTDRLRDDLAAALKDDIDRFRMWTGRDFADWSI